VNRKWKCLFLPVWVNWVNWVNWDGERFISFIVVFIVVHVLLLNDLVWVLLFSWRRDVVDWRRGTTHLLVETTSPSDEALEVSPTDTAEVVSRSSVVTTVRSARIIQRKDLTTNLYVRTPYETPGTEAPDVGSTKWAVRVQNTTHRFTCNGVFCPVHSSPIVPTVPPSRDPSSPFWSHSLSLHFS